MTEAQRDSQNGTVEESISNLVGSGSLEVSLTSDKLGRASSEQTGELSISTNKSNVFLSSAYFSGHLNNLP